jgi:hypothetical protein
VCHLVRRKGVGEEFRSGFEHGGRRSVRGAGVKNFGESSVMDGGKLDETDAALERLAADFIGSA